MSRLHGSDTLELTAVYAKRQHEQPSCLGVMHLREVCRCVTPSKIVAENSGIAGFKVVAANLGINCVTRLELWNRKEDPYFWATYHVRNRQGKHHRSTILWVLENMCRDRSRSAFPCKPEFCKLLNLREPSSHSLVAWNNPES